MELARVGEVKEGLVKDGHPNGLQLRQHRRLAGAMRALKTECSVGEWSTQLIFDSNGRREESRGDRRGTGRNRVRGGNWTGARGGSPAKTTHQMTILKEAAHMG